MARPRNRRRRSGHTLVELVIAVAVSGILVAGLTSTLYVASRAVNVSGPTRDVLTASAAAADVLGELQYAITFTERSENAVEFTVADRNGDLATETIRYAWSGIAGDPLTRRYNGGTTVTVAEDVHDFFLEYHTRTVTDAGGGGGGPTSPPVFHEFTEAKLFTEEGAIDVSKPGGTSSGDLLIAAVAIDASESSMSAPGDWNLVATESNAPKVMFGVWWKVAGGSEPSNYQFTWPGTQQAYGWIMRFTGHDAANPIDAFASANQGDSTSPTSPAVTSTADNVLIVRLGGFDDKDITVDSPGLSGHTAITMDTTGTADGAVSGGAGFVAQGTAGNSGTSTFALTDAEQSATVTLAITPDPGGGGGGGSDKYYNLSVDVRLQVGDDSASRIDGATHVLNAPEVPNP
jgi:type II secretory pathway pseudopilin PulG